MSGAELTEIPNLGERGENRLIPRPDSGEGEGVRVENPIASAVEGGPLESEMQDVKLRSRTDQFLDNKVIREEEENGTWKGEGKEEG